MFGRYFALLVAAVALSPVVQANGIPADDALFAKTADEFIAAQKKSATRMIQPRSHLEQSEPILASYFGGEPGFYHGVASGDPLSDRVIVWVRYTPDTLDPVTLELRIAEVDSSIPFESHLDTDANDSIKVAKVEVGESSDFIAKIDVSGLKSNTHYVFAFTDGTVVSDVGQTRTAPAKDENVEEMTYAFFSCAHFSNGYFHSYDVASTIKNLDFWVHVGDYIYEYGIYEPYATDVSERKDVILPVWEIVDLQDYRNRYATYHLDEGLRNLRRRAPLIAIWDDHELTNNAYGQGGASDSGAENHQDVCSANRTSTDSEKASAQCDRDEGNVKLRFDAAAQAYMEWMPLRRGPGSMGVVDITSITQVIEWGNLASIVAVDTRITDRSKEPTLGSGFADFAGYAYANANVSAYYDTDSEVRQTFELIAAGAYNKYWNPEYTMVGEENTKLIMDVFEESKAANKPWQIYAAGTMMGPQLAPNVDKMADYVPANLAPFVKGYTDAVLADPSGYLLRAAVAMDLTKTPYNTDGFDGFSHERAALINGFMEKANNPIILGGDLHDSWAWTLYEGGQMDGKPAAVNLGCPGVTSPGWGPFLSGAFAPLADAVGGFDNVYKLIADTFVGGNKGMVYADVAKKGFVAIKATKEHHIAEYILFEGATTVSNYEVARAASGEMTAAYTCGVSLVTTAGEPGSLVPQDECEIKFDTERPAVWDLPFPITGAPGGDSLYDCGYNACEFVATGNVAFSVVSEKGCLTAQNFKVGAPIKAMECKGFKIQMWMVDEIGQIHSMKDTSKCLMKDGVSLILGECDDSGEDISTQFGYNSFDNTLFFAKNAFRVADVTGSSVKMMKKKIGDTNQKMEPHFY